MSNLQLETSAASKQATNTTTATATTTTTYLITSIASIDRRRWKIKRQPLNAWLIYVVERILFLNIVVFIIMIICEAAVEIKTTTSNRPITKSCSCSRRSCLLMMIFKPSIISTLLNRGLMIDRTRSQAAASCPANKQARRPELISLFSLSLSLSLSSFNSCYFFFSATIAASG